MRRSSVSVLGLGPALSLLLAAGCATGGPQSDPTVPPETVPLETVPPEDVTSDAQPIINGSADTVNDAVCALMAEYQGDYYPFCTATIIARDGATAYAITAAHCVTGGQATPEAVACTDNYSDCPGSSCKLFPVTAYQAHPEANDQSTGHDVAMLTLGQASTADVIPAIGADDGLADGDALEFSGYGLINGFDPNSASSQAAGRNHSFSIVEQLYLDAIESPQSHSGQYGGTCSGDSGGPVFTGEGAAKRLVGITSSGDQDCDIVGYYGRVEYVWDFVSAYIGEEPVDACLTCANDSLGAACALQFDACNADADCVAFWSCLDACGANDAACPGNCQAAHPGGAALHAAMTDCAFCTACDATCQDPACDAATTATTTGAGGGDGAGGGGGGESDDDDDDGRADGNEGETTVTTCDCAVPGGATGASNPALLAGIALAFGLVSRRRRTR